MNDEILNQGIRKYLKNVGITSHESITAAVSAGLADGSLKGDETLTLRMTLQITELGLEKTIEGVIPLE